MKKLKKAPEPQRVTLSKEQVRLITIRKLQVLYKTLDEGNYVKRYLLILNGFLSVYYSITYRFTTQEAINVIKRRERNEHLIKLLDEIGSIFYMKQEPSAKQMKVIIIDTIKILNSLGPLPDNTVKTSHLPPSSK